jgi:hypothetical protein
VYQHRRALIHTGYPGACVYVSCRYVCTQTYYNLVICACNIILYLRKWHVLHTITSYRVFTSSVCVYIRHKYVWIGVPFMHLTIISAWWCGDETTNKTHPCKHSLLLSVTCTMRMRFLHTTHISYKTTHLIFCVNFICKTCLKLGTGQCPSTDHQGLEPITVYVKIYSTLNQTEAM